MDKENTRIVLDLLKNEFYTWKGYICGIIFTLFLYVPIDNFLEKVFPDILLRLDILFALFLVWTIYWIFRRNEFPKVHSNVIGLIIAIQTENDIQRIKLKNNFIDELKKLLKENNLNNLFDVIHLNNYQSIKTDEYCLKYSRIINNDPYLDERTNKKYKKEWREFQKKIGGHFFITGKIRSANDNEPKYIIDNFSGLVIHKEVGRNTAIQVKNEFINSWWKEVNFPEKFDYKGFSFAVDLTYLPIKYIIGIAALISGDLDLAIRLHESLGNDFVRIKLKYISLPLNLLFIENNYKKVLAEEYLIKARRFFISNNDLPKTREYLDKSLSLVEDNYPAYILESIYYFSKNLIDEALESTNKAKDMTNGGDGTWRYNKAFLLMYKGDINKGFKLYKEISQTEFKEEEKILDQVYTFCKNILNKNSNNYLVYFILGFLYFKKSKNYPLAWKYLQIFIKHSKNVVQFKFILKKAIAYRNMCNKIMDLS